MLARVYQLVSFLASACMHCVEWFFGAGEEGKVRERQVVVRGYRPGVLSYILLCPVEYKSLGM